MGKYHLLLPDAVLAPVWLSAVPMQFPVLVYPCRVTHYRVPGANHSEKSLIEEKTNMDYFLCLTLI